MGHNKEENPLYMLTYTLDKFQYLQPLEDKPATLNGLHLYTMRWNYLSGELLIYLATADPNTCFSQLREKLSFYETTHYTYFLNCSGLIFSSILTESVLPKGTGLYTARYRILRLESAF